MMERLCVCANVQEARQELADLRTRVVVIMHYREWFSTTSTAQLAAAALPDCTIRLRGLHGQSLQTDDLITADRQSLLLFPSHDAVELTPELVEKLDRAAMLLVLDGSWSQARRSNLREPALSGVPRIKLVPGPRSKYRLRKEPDAASVCTFEAIARALGVLEGADRGPRARAMLERLFDIRVERSLLARGKLRAHQIRYPIPKHRTDLSAE
jgi:DTW domain-containing protein YfiP